MTDEEKTLLLKLKAHIDSGNEIIRRLIMVLQQRILPEAQGEYQVSSGTSGLSGSTLAEIRAQYLESQSGNSTDFTGSMSTTNSRSNDSSNIAAFRREFSAPNSGLHSLVYINKWFVH